MTIEGRRQDRAPIRVVVVDDHDLFRTGLVALLSAQPDIEVVGQASSAGKAVRLARDLRPEVIVMDLRLPDLDGADAVARLRAAPHTSRIPVVAVTALRLDADEEWLSESGFAGYIAKPIDTDELPDLVRRFAAGKRD